jgi:plastocyanin
MLRLIGIAVSVLLLVACGSKSNGTADRPQPSASAERTATQPPTAGVPTAAPTDAVEPTPLPPTATALSVPTTVPLAPAPTQRSSSQSPQRVEPVKVELQANDLKFSVERLTVPAHAEVTIVLRNNDTAVLHDIGAALPGVGHSAACAGPCTVSLTFAAHEAGRYHFFCSIHPDMVGDLIVTP